MDSVLGQKEVGINQNLGSVEEGKELRRLMATAIPPSSSEDQKIQPSASTPSPEALVDEKITGSPGPRVEPSHSPLSTSLKRTRDWSSDSEDEELTELLIPEREPVWAVEMLCGLKMKLKKRRVSSVLPEHHKAFTRLLEDPVVKRFLASDKTLRVSDKYLLAMVIAYFSRSGLSPVQYRPIHFFLALYLAHDMEEDNQVPKQDILYFLYGKSFVQRPMFHKLRFHFIMSMGWRTWVSREECEEIQAYNPQLWVWKRDRTTLPQDPVTMEA